MSLKFNLAPASQLNGISQQAIINGNFDVWQRGTSFTTTGQLYSADRWECDLNSATLSRQSSGPPIGSKYFARVTMNGASTFGNMYYAFESDTAQKLAGKQVTLSVKLRRNSTFLTDIIINLQKGTVADTVFGGAWTTLGTVAVLNSTISTGTTSSDWIVAKVTALIPNDGSAVGLRLYVSMSAAQGSGTYYEVSQVQFNTGDQALPFQPKDLDDETKKSLRYAFIPQTNSVFIRLTSYTANTLVFNVPLPVQMRAAPTIRGIINTDMIAYNMAAAAQSGFTAAATLTSNGVIVTLTKTTHGLTDAYLEIKTTSGFEAEL